MIKNSNTHTIKINPRRTVMKILFYDTKSYDKESFEATLAKYPGIQIEYIRPDLDPRTAALADGFDAVCAFGVILVNTSRGALVKTEDLIEGIRLHKFAGVGLDVYEEETKNVFEDRSDEILEHSTTARLLSFPNVMITSHQGFFTKEALESIA